ncbi:hypothetical protein DFQ11_107136 [Winogradskyella epiphytica]|uniref:RND transporter n=1 Tax=Winogradskyella epiphytica TaxID=262005 RepID=A0A2V4XX12_9FLAO|nr:hypothetical protein [Winogradskyella epiphytica]PYE80164.1 hypothetical protein DFQ11_107136 [Winogradskyella epiphytica]GGW71756.1 hypothetical protein GCM10008085_24970 [Winogradskyella epiphytica]
MELINDWRIVALLCLTLGLAPFVPEPHLLGKIRWIAGGENGMEMKDYFDVLLHGFPFILLLRIIILKLKKSSTEPTSDQ